LVVSTGDLVLVDKSAEDRGRQIAGPTVTGLLIQALTAPVAIAVDAVSFAGSALFVRRIRRREATL
jgi:hypothetical protein